MYCSVTSTVVRMSAPSKVFYTTESRGGGGSGLDLGPKVSAYHGEFGEKRKQIAPGVQHCVPTANLKKRRSRHLYKGEYGKKYPKRKWMFLEILSLLT